MFRTLSKHFPDRSSSESTGAGQKAHQKLNRILLLGALLLGVSVASPFLLSSPEPPANAPRSISGDSPANTDRTPAPADPSPVDFASPGMLIAVLLLAGGVGLALYLRNGAPQQPPPSSLIVPIAQHKISPQQKVCLIRCADELLLLAVSPEQIDLLTTYPREAVPARGDAAAAADRPPPQDSVGFDDTLFADVLKNYTAPFTTRRTS